MKLGSPVTEIQIYVTLKERVWLEDHYVSTDGNLLVERHVRKVLGVPQKASQFFSKLHFFRPGGYFICFSYHHKPVLCLIQLVKVLTRANTVK